MFKKKDIQKEKQEQNAILLELRLENDFLLESFPEKAHHLQYVSKEVDILGNTLTVLHHLDRYAHQIKQVSKELILIKEKILDRNQVFQINQEIDFFKSEALYDIDFTLMKLVK